MSAKETVGAVYQPVDVGLNDLLFFRTGMATGDIQLLTGDFVVWPNQQFWVFPQPAVRKLRHIVVCSLGSARRDDFRTVKERRLGNDVQRPTREKQLVLRLGRTMSATAPIDN